MHVLETIEDLPDVMFDVVHLDCRFLFLSLSQCVFQTGIAILHHRVLNDPLLLIYSVEELNELYDVWSTFEEGEHFILARDDIASFLGAFESHLLLSVDVEGFEDIAFKINQLAVKLT